MIWKFGCVTIGDAKFVTPIRYHSITRFHPETMNRPTFAIAVTFQIKPEHAESFRERILRQATDSVEKESGCCQFDVLTDESDPTTFFLYETYVDSEAFETHKRTPHFADYDATVADWVVAKQVRRMRLASPENR